MISARLRRLIEAEIDGNEDPMGVIEELRQLIHDHSPLKAMPVDRIKWVPIDMVEANSYNPNKTASIEMNLLYVSIRADGLTQPIVTVWDEERNRAVIVDGFHRYFTVKSNPDLLERTHGLLPIVVIDKAINDRMAATVRHNRARGKHSVQGMSSLVFEMLDNGWTDAEISNELGMSAEELLRLKHVTGFSKLFKDAEYSRAWKTKAQLRIERSFRDEVERLKVEEPDSPELKTQTDVLAERKAKERETR